MYNFRNPHCSFIIEKEIKMFLIISAVYDHTQSKYRQEKQIMNEGWR